MLESALWALRKPGGETALREFALSTHSCDSCDSELCDSCDNELWVWAAARASSPSSSPSPTPDDEDDEDDDEDDDDCTADEVGMVEGIEAVTKCSDFLLTE